MKLKNRIAAMVLSAAMAFSFIPAVFAADNSTAIIDTSRETSLTLYKYDLTSAEQDGVWEAQSYVSTGLQDEAVNMTLAPYAVEGVEFSYIKLAELGILKTNEGTEYKVMPLYGFTENTKTNSRETVDFLAVLGLTTNDAYTVQHDSRQNRIWYFQSNTLIDALEAALTTNATSTQTALEAYMAANGGTAMPETDENGYSHAEGLKQGLYLLLETRVPENVVDATDPFLVSLPMTTVDGGEWNYNVTAYPKNATGDPTLEKTVREAKADTGKNGGSVDNITGGYAHTATASDGDTVEYQIISTMPTITSPATALTTYTFVDTLSKGLRYNGEWNDTKEVKLEFFKDAACTDPITTWTEQDGMFTVSYTDYSTESGSKMTITMMDNGLSEINSSTAVYDTKTSLYRGFSNCTLRINYSCTVNSDATMACGDSGNPNEVELTWRRTNTSYFDTLKDCCHVYSYGIDLTKKFSDGAGNFEKVKFLVYNDTDQNYVQAELEPNSGIYYVTGHTQKKSKATLFSPGSSAGKVTVKGLEDDTYTIIEMATDKGYTLLKENISVAISQTEGDTVCDCCGAKLLTTSAKVNNSAVTMNEDNSSVNAIVPLSVTNTKGYDLPKTGGNGALALYVLGIVSVISAAGIVVGYFIKKKRHA